MKDFIYWFFDKLFSDKINTAICWILLALAIAFIAFQAVRGINYILIAGIC